MRWLVLVLVACSGGALTAKAPSLEVRYFAPPAVAAHPAATPCAKLDVGEISASSHLRYPIAYRTSPVELDLYDALRWTERPETYVRRSLARALFGSGKLDEAIGGPQTAIDIEIVGFEEVRRGDQRAGRVALSYVVRDEHHVVTRGTVATERPARSREIEAIVAAIGAALDAATDEVAARVSRTLCSGSLPGT